MEGIGFLPQRNVHAALDAPEVAQPHRHDLFRELLLRIISRDHEIARHDDIGPIDHDVVDGAVEGLGLRVDLIGQLPGIDRPGGLLRRLLLVFVDDLHLVGELQDRAGERLGAAPTGGDFEPAGIGRHLAVPDLALDHRQRNEHQKGKHAHQGDLQGKGIFQFHTDFLLIFANTANNTPWQTKRSYSR